MKVETEIESKNRTGQKSVVKHQVRVSLSDGKERVIVGHLPSRDDAKYIAQEINKRVAAAAAG